MGMLNEARKMIGRIVEGKFDWQDLERMYGSEFDPHGRVRGDPAHTTVSHPDLNRPDFERDLATARGVVKKSLSYPIAHPPSREDLHGHLLSTGWKHSGQGVGVNTYTHPKNADDQIGVSYDGKWQRFNKGALIASGTGKDDIIRHFRQSGGR